MDWELIINNWAQITVVIGAVGFFFQSWTIYKLRKQEITFSSLQANRIEELKRFFESYHELYIAVSDFLHETEFRSHADVVI